MTIKLFAGLLFVMTLSTTTQAQTAYYDAFKLKQLVKDSGDFTDPDAALKILQSYTSQAGVVRAFKANIHIGQFLQHVQESNLRPLGGVVSSIGNIDVTNFADGLAKLIVSRVRTDLNTYFFEKFQVFLDRDCPELKVLFPNTDLLINHFASTDYANVLNTLREAFDKDLHNLLATIPNLNTITVPPGAKQNVILRIQYLKKFFDSDPGRLFLSAIAAGNGIINGQKFPDILNVITARYLSGWTDPDTATQTTIRGSVNLFNILSYSVRSKDAGVDYVTKDQLKQLFQDPLAQQFFLGLIWQQLTDRNVIIGDIVVAKSLDQFVTGAIAYLDTLVAEGVNFSTTVDSLAAAKKRGVVDLSPYWAASFNSANNLLAVAADIQIINPKLSFSDTVKKAFAYSTDIIDIGHDVSVRSYNAVVIDLLKLITDIVPPGQDPRFDTAVLNFVRYASFAANVVTAKTSDDVQSAIEAIALPAGSSVMERNTRFTISINAYGGAFVGYEYMPVLKTRTTAVSAGVTAPVGFAFTFGNLGRSADPKNVNGKSITLFVPLIDVGALAAFRFQDSTTSTAANVQLKNIIAPGLYAYFGFGKCPLSVGIGAQVGPQLRDISATQANIDKNYYIRYGLNLLFDIPLFNLYSKSR